MGCIHNNNPGSCLACEAVLASQLQRWPVFVGERSQIQLAANIRQRFSERLSSLRTFATQISRLPASYWPLLQADQAFLDVLGQEMLLIAERGEALLQEETRATFWVQHQQGQTTEAELTANQRIIVLLVIPGIEDIAQYQPLASAPRNSQERFYRQALPRVVRSFLEWFIEGKTLVLWQEERDTRRRVRESLRPLPKKGQGGKRPGAGRPKGTPTRVLSLRIGEPLYQHLAEQAREAGLPLSVFLETWLETQVSRKTPKP